MMMRSRGRWAANGLRDRFLRKLQLIEEPRLAFIARPEDLPLELLDGEPQMRDQRLRTGRLGMLLGKLGIAGAKEPLQRLEIIG